MSAVHEPGAGDLVGRAGELGSTELALRRHRLVTLTGAPGIGKTTVARVLAAGATPPGLFCDLVPVSSRVTLIERLAQALGVGRAGGRDHGLRGVVAALRERGELLVVLDNAEHVMPHVRWLVGGLLEDTGVRLLVTSREALGSKAECRRELPPLSRDDTLALLCHRLDKAGVAVSPEDAVVRELATRLDGVPLAVEIAAAQAQNLPLSRILGSFDRVMARARSPFRDEEPRHASMRSALAGSWARLGARERGALRELTVFRSSFERTDAEDLLASARAPDGGAVVDALADQSLLIRDATRSRLRILEPIRDFVRDAAGPPSARAERRAVEVLSAKATRLARQLRGPQCTAAVEVLEDQLFDLVAAAEWLVRAGRPRDAAELVCALDEYLAWRGPFSLSLRLLSFDEPTLAALPSGLRARVHACRGRAHVLLGNRAQAHRELAAARRARGASAAVARARAELWEALSRYWSFEAESAAEGLARAAAQARAAGSSFEAALAELYHGCVLGESGRNAESARRFDRAARRIERHGILALRPRLDVYRLHFSRASGPPPEERGRRLSRALALTEQLRDLRFSAAVLTALGDLEVGSGNPDGAVVHYELAARRYQDVGFATAVPFVRLSLALAHWMAGRLDVARAILLELADAPGGRVANAWYARAALAGLDAESRRIDRARRALQECAEAAASGDPVLARVVALFMLLLRAVESGHAARASRALDAHRGWAAETPGSNSEVVLALQVVDARLSRIASARPEAPVLELGPEATWFRVAPARPVPLGRRRALRRILTALAAGAPSRWSTAEELFAVGWPGERAAPRSAAFRVYTAVRTLRGLGLGGLLQTGAEGYRLAAEVRGEASPIDRQDEP